MEVGGYKNGLHCGFTFNDPQVRFNLGNRRSTLQISSFHTRSHQLQCSKVCKGLHRSHAMLARGSEDNNLRPRSQFVARFWEQLHASLETHLIHSSAYHPQTDGQTERVNQILEDMLRACVLEHPGSWDQNLPWAEFSYNNRYQESIKMAPFEVPYGCRCRTPLNWIELGEKVIFGPDLVQEVESIVHQVQENLKAAKSRQETYANKRR
jgi:hypothetical protein